MLVRPLFSFGFASVLLAHPLSHAATYNFENNTGMGGVVCTTFDNCSTVGGALTFNGALGVMSAKGYYTPSLSTNPVVWGGKTVVQDDFNGSNNPGPAGQPPWVGLGVYHTAPPYDSNDDNITSMEALVLTFDNTVTITNVKLRAEGHEASFYPSGGPVTSFAYGLGTPGGLPSGTPGSANTMSFVNGQKDYDIVDLTGKVFVFYGLPNIGAVKQEYYLSAITVVPEPEAYGMALAGMGVVCLAMRGRRGRRSS